MQVLCDAGTLHPAWGNISSLEYLNMSGNALSGCLPDAWSRLNLITLDLNANALNCAPDLSLSGAFGLRKSRATLNTSGRSERQGAWKNSALDQCHSCGLWPPASACCHVYMRGVQVKEGPVLQLINGSLPCGRHIAQTRHTMD